MTSRQRIVLACPVSVLLIAAGVWASRAFPATPGHADVGFWAGMTMLFALGQLWRWAASEVPKPVVRRVQIGLIVILALGLIVEIVISNRAGA